VDATSGSGALGGGAASPGPGPVRLALPGRDRIREDGHPGDRGARNPVHRPGAGGFGGGPAPRRGGGGGGRRPSWTPGKNGCSGGSYRPGIETFLEDRAIGCERDVRHLQGGPRGGPARQRLSMDSHYDQVMKARERQTDAGSRLYFAYSTILDRKAFE